jgi:hypothetical protein
VEENAARRKLVPILVRHSETKEIVANARRVYKQMPRAADVLLAE